MMWQWVGFTVAATTFQLNDIPEEGLTVELDLSPDDLALSPDDAEIRGDSHASLTVERGVGRVAVHGTMTATFVDECVRCLKHSERVAEIPISAEYRVTEAPGRHRQPRREREAREESTEIADHDDVYVIAGDHLDLAEMLREQLILSLPMQPLCSDTCRGLCPVCGRDRNERDCGCHELQRQNPFSVLQDRFKKHE